MDLLAPPLPLQRSMSLHHTNAAKYWLKDKKICSTALVVRMYSLTDQNVTLTVWLEKTGANQYVEKRVNGEYKTDLCKSISNTCGARQNA